MRRMSLASLVIVLAGCSTSLRTGPTTVSRENAIAATIVAMEKAALDRWCKGDPAGFLEISDSEVVYFDPMQEKRLDGIEALTRLYESVRGKIRVEHYELVNPKVQVCGDMAVLTFNYSADTEEKFSHWNCTEVYQRKNGQWRIIQTHWSVTQPFKK